MAVTSPTQLNWRPTADLRRLVWLALASLLAAAWGSFALGVFFDQENLAVLVLVAFGVCYFLLHVRAFQLLESEPGLDGIEKGRLMSRLKFFGPAGILVLAWRCLVAK
jgi:hypothetical protein